MRLLVELAGDHPTLPRAEVSAVLRSYGEAPPLPSGRVIVFNSSVPPGVLAARLALSHFVHEEIATGSLPELLEVASGLVPSGPFRVRVKSYVTCEGKAEMERALAARICGTADLTNPATEYVLVAEEGGLHLTRRLGATDRTGFERRRPSRRPFFHPTTLHPRWARTLVNLARCPPGGTLADPFCGTGGILLEAALCGFQALGTDVSEEMVAGAGETLAAYGVAASLRAGDLSLLAGWEGVQAVATDPPYGRAATTRREPPRDLYRRFFEAAAGHAARGAAVAVILPGPEFIELGERVLRLEESHRLRVHRSLDRHFCVYASP